MREIQGYGALPYLCGRMQALRRRVQGHDSNVMNMKNVINVTE
jgi:hypothetical protein